MRKIYKYLIVSAAILVLLLCSVVSVGAAEKYSRSGTVSSKELYNVYFEGYPTGGRGWVINQSYYNNRNNFSAYPDTGNYYISGGGEWGFRLPTAPFNFDPFEDYHIRFDIGNWFLRGFENSYSLRMFISSGPTTLDYELSYDNTNGSSSSPDYVFFDCYLPSSFISANNGYFDITIYVSSNYVGTLSYDPALFISNFTYSCMTNEEEAINNAVGTITGGWSPDPEAPDNSEDVGELGSIEEQLQQGSEDGINAGMDMITNLGESLAGFQKGFAFFMDFSDLLFGEISWFSSLVTIALSLGIVAFLLNIIGSVASKISRDQSRAKNEAYRVKRDADNAAHREKQHEYWKSSMDYHNSRMKR